MSNTLDILEMLHRRATNPDVGRGPYTVADACLLSVEMQKQANLAKTLLGGLGRGMQELTWEAPLALGGVAGRAVRPLGKLFGGAGSRAAGAGGRLAQGAAGLAENLITFPLSSPENFGHSLLMGFLGHQALSDASRMKALGQVVKPRGAQGGAFKSVFERMG